MDVKERGRRTPERLKTEKGSPRPCLGPGRQFRWRLKLRVRYKECDYRYLTKLWLPEDIGLERGWTRNGGCMSSIWWSGGKRKQGTSWKNSWPSTVRTEDLACHSTNFLVHYRILNNLQYMDGRGVTLRNRMGHEELKKMDERARYERAISGVRFMGKRKLLLEMLGTWLDSWESTLNCVDKLLRVDQSDYC